MASLVPDISILFKTNGEEKRLDFQRVPFSAWSELKRDLHFTPKTLPEAMAEFDLEAFGAVIWLERRQTERTLSWASVRQQLDKGAFDFEILEVLVDASEPDPQSADS